MRYILILGYLLSPIRIFCDEAHKKPRPSTTSRPNYSKATECVQKFWGVFEKDGVCRCHYSGKSIPVSSIEKLNGSKNCVDFKFLISANEAMNKAETRFSVCCDPRGKLLPRMMLSDDCAELAGKVVLWSKCERNHDENVCCEKYNILPFYTWIQTCTDNQGRIAENGLCDEVASHNEEMVCCQASSDHGPDYMLWRLCVSRNDRVNRSNIKESSLCKKQYEPQDGKICCLIKGTRYEYYSGDGPSYAFTPDTYLWKEVSFDCPKDLHVANWKCPQKD